MNEQVSRIVADVLGMDEERVTEDLSPSTADNWDSMSHLRIVTAIEEEWGISFSMEEVQAIDTWESSSRTSGVTHETNGHPEAVSATSTARQPHLFRQVPRLRQPQSRG